MSKVKKPTVFAAWETPPAPCDPPTRPPWKRGQRARGINSPRVESDTEPAVLPWWVEHRDWPGWLFTVTLDRGGRSVAISVRPLTWRSSKNEGLTWYEPDDRIPVDAEELTARRWREIPVGEIRNCALAEARALLSWYFEPTSEWAHTVRSQPRPGRRGRSDRFYAEVASEYAQLIGSGSAAATIARRRCLSIAQVRGLLGEARRRELLTAAPRGREGGTLTETARKILENEGR
jgi:hypothetical protein